jgi:hypothetical protein
MNTSIAKFLLGLALVAISPPLAVLYALALIFGGPILRHRAEKRQQAITQSRLRPLRP